MTLVRFRVRNHPGQVGRRGALDTVDERITPDTLFSELHAAHGFTLDAAAAPGNAKCARFCSLSDSGLERSWVGEVVWCNPPYSALPAWVAYARQQVSAGCRKAVLLLPANRTEQRWWQEHIEPFRDRPGSGVSVRFLPRRINFGTPANPTGRWHSSAPFGCCVVVLDPASHGGRESSGAQK